MTLTELQNFLKDPESIKRIGIAPLPIRIGAIILLVVVILGGGYWKAVKPVFTEIDQLEKKEIDLKEVFDQKQRKAANLSAYK
jgi:type IV pilus assembly protein PilO